MVGKTSSVAGPLPSVQNQFYFIYLADAGMAKFTSNFSKIIELYMFQIFQCVWSSGEL